MKKINFIISVCLFIFITSSYGQSLRYFEAEYDIYYNTDIPQSRKGKLQIDIENNHSIFHIGKKNDGKEPTSATNTTEFGESYVVSYKDELRFIEINFKNESVFSKETHGGKTYYVKDKPHNFNWELNYTDTKKIGNMLCQKATSYFRGRNYTAWYTTEIPLFYGPYKFHGLPGLIVSISDSEEIFVWTLASYKSTSQKPQFMNFEGLKPVLSLKEYYSDIRYPSENNQQDVIQSRLPKGVNIISVSSDAHVRKGVEIKFEWEENKQ